MLLLIASLATAAVTGVVTMAGAPVKGVLVRVASVDSSVVTDAKGTFTIRGLRAGDDTLIVYHVRSVPDRVAITLASGITSSVPIAVSVPTAIDTLDLDALRMKSAYSRVGFDTWRTSGRGFYLDQSEIGRRHATQLSDLVRPAPGFRVRDVGTRRSIVTSRGGRQCVAYYVDRMRFRSLHAGDADDIVRPNEIAALEAYASNPPAEFGGGHGCAAIVIWTKTHLGT